jgi:hypothetical protein
MPDARNDSPRTHGEHPFPSGKFPGHNLRLPSLSDFSTAPIPSAPIIGAASIPSNPSHTISSRECQTFPLSSHPITGRHVPNNSSYGTSIQSGSRLEGMIQISPPDVVSPTYVSRPSSLWTDEGGQSEIASRFTSHYPSIYPRSSAGHDQLGNSSAQSTGGGLQTMLSSRPWTSTVHSPRRSSIHDLLSEPPGEPAIDNPASEMKGPESRPPWVGSNSKVKKVRDSTYKIIVRQQPVCARACGNGEKDRRVIDPPPIIQLLVEDPAASKAEVQRRLQDAYTVSCTIWSESGKEEVDRIPDERIKRRLTGQLAACPFVGRDDAGNSGTFFCFPDLSVRTQGIYRLRFTIIAMSAARAIGTRLPVLGSTLSDKFTVYAPKDFPGMKLSTPLTVTLRAQGAYLNINKIAKPKKGKGTHDHGKDEGEGDWDEDEDVEMEDGR